MQYDLYAIQATLSATNVIANINPGCSFRFVPVSSVFCFRLAAIPIINESARIETNTSIITGKVSALSCHLLSANAQLSEAFVEDGKEDSSLEHWNAVFLNAHTTDITVKARAPVPTRVVRRTFPSPNPGILSLSATEVHRTTRASPAENRNGMKACDKFPRPTSIRAIVANMGVKRIAITCGRCLSRSPGFISLATSFGLNFLPRAKSNTKSIVEAVMRRRISSFSVLPMRNERNLHVIGNIANTTRHISKTQIPACIIRFIPHSGFSSTCFWAEILKVNWFLELAEDFAEDVAHLADRAVSAHAVHNAGHEVLFSICSFIPEYRK